MQNCTLYDNSAERRVGERVIGITNLKIRQMYTFRYPGMVGKQYLYVNQEPHFTNGYWWGVTWINPQNQQDCMVAPRIANDFWHTGEFNLTNDRINIAYEGD